LTRKLALEELRMPRLGVLVFHPSILPYRRGPDAIRWATQSGDRVSGVTWFWADEGLDTGPICEQEPVVLAPGESPGRAYHTRFQPAGLTALARALDGILAGRPRRIPQEEPLASYESFYPTGD
jgi:methionyl-tRNA formyltransferase